MPQGQKKFAPFGRDSAPDENISVPSKIESIPYNASMGGVTNNNVRPNLPYEE